MAALLGAAEVRRDTDKPGGGCAYLDRLLPGLVRVVEENRLSPAERAEAGRILGRLGDPRDGVTDVDRMEFCFVPPGAFLMGSEDDPLGYADERPQHEILIPNGYFLGRFSVTNGQYLAFVKEGGYRLPHLWTEAKGAGVWNEGWVKGRYDNAPRDRPEDYGEPVSLPNHPVVGIAWYEALAFVRWLEDRWRLQGLLPGGWKVRLPSEAEWEKAARGGLEIPKGRIIRRVGSFEWPSCALVRNEEASRRYPWGEEADPNKANYDDSGIRATSAAGCFSSGAGPYGCEEVSGNVWEWTRSANRGYPYVATDGRESLDAGPDVPRVLRGGSFFYYSRLVRCSYRDWLYPDLHFDYVGLRLVASPS